MCSIRKLSAILALLIIVGFLASVFRNHSWSARDRFQPLAPGRLSPSGSVGSRLPLAVDAGKVGTYPSLVKSGGGYFYDDVLEYRVWIDPQSGGERLNEGSDYFKAFSTYESAKRFSETTKGAEPPIVLVRQLEHVNEPKEGVFEHVTGERLTEWHIEWLEGSKRGPNSIADFLSKKSKK
ncbi:MAG: GCN5 family acetyltransferase [Kiritimatiellia bacterium]